MSRVMVTFLLGALYFLVTIDLWIHLSLFVRGVESDCFIFTLLDQFSTPLKEEIVFTHCISLAPFVKDKVHGACDYLLGFLFCSLINYFCLLCQYHIIFDDCVCRNLASGADSPVPFPSSTIALLFKVLCIFYTNIWIIWFVLWKYGLGSFDRTTNL